MKTQLTFDIFERHILYRKMVIKNNTYIGGNSQQDPKGGIVNKSLKRNPAEKRQKPIVFASLYEMHILYRKSFQN